jgi:ketosteroid isomerase-like protein
MKLRSKSFAAFAFGSLLLMQTAAASDDKAMVAALDTAYQAAVQANDVAGMDRILADDFVLVTGNGKTFNKTDLLNDARAASNTFEHQQDSQQTVRVWGDTAVVTALLWVKGRNKEQSFDYKLWFSDVYVRTPGGWRYAFGQASTRVPAA